MTLEAVSFRADPELVDKIETLAEAQGKTVSEVVRILMQTAVEREVEATTPPSGGRYRLKAKGA